VINTDRRTYLLEPRSTDKTYMASVSWQYPEDQLIALRRQNQEAQAAAPIAAGVDLTSINFRYAIQGDNPAWRPLRAFDDGSKVYIEFPSGIAQGEMPPLFVIGPAGGSELVNNRVSRNYLLGQKRGLAKGREGNEDEPGERRQLELDQGDEELDREDEEGDQDQKPRQHQHSDLDEIGEEAGEAHHRARRVEQRLTGVEPDLGEVARLQEGGGRDGRTASLQTEAREAVEDDRREVVEIADDESEEADVQGLLHQALHNVLVSAQAQNMPASVMSMTIRVDDR
jgi:hypothetical protein